MSHNPMDRSITAFTLDDLGVQHTGHGTTFVAPPTPSVDLIVQDNDGYLSGDRFGNARDRTEQTADINRFGVDTGNDRQIYADRAIVLRGDDHQTYILIEIDQERANTPVYTYFADVPPAGTELTVIGSFNVHGSLPYARLGAGDAPQNIVDIAAGSSDFDLLVKALAAADLVNTVKDLTDVTVFAPTDAAFTQLAVDLGFTGDTTDEDAVFNAIVDALTALAPDGNPIPLLTDVLLYHVSAGAKTAAQIDAADKVATLLPGATFETSGTELIDNEPDVDNPSIVIPDIVAANGRIQALDRVLLPIDIPGNTAQPTQTLAEIVGDSGGVFDTDGEDFDILLTSLGAADLVTALDDPAASLTGFLPTDDAFIATAQALGFEGSGEADAFGYIVNALTLLSGGEDPIPLLRDILLYHVAPTALDSGAVLGATSIPTLLGPSLGVNGLALVDGEPDLRDPELIQTDILATNGIAHVLDGVLIPVDLLQSDGANDVDFEIGSNARDVFRTGADADFASGLGGRDVLWLGKGDDVGLGGAGNDFLGGASGDDLLRGDGGNDVLRGGWGDDTLFGGSGRDFLTGSKGDDVLTGGGGSDTFIFGHASGDDVITDFALARDLLILRGTVHSDFGDLADAISDSADGAVVAVGPASITLTGIAAADLSEDDFLFT